MRLIFYNPHTNIDMGNTLINFLTRKYSFKRYKYLLDFAFENNKEMVFLIDKDASSIPFNFPNLLPVSLELFFWALINRFNPFKLEIIYDYEKIKKDDILFVFVLENLETENPKILKIASKKNLKIFHINHYMQNTSLISKNLKKLNCDLIVSENNLSKNSEYFKKMFPFYKKDVYVLPFVFQKRFKKIRDFSKRKNKCIATGTIINIKEFGGEKNNIFKDFYSFFKVDYLHPMRKEIYDNKKENKKMIDSFIANFWEKRRKEWKTQEPLFNKWKKILFNAFVASQRKYLKFNIVEKYNEYKMFVVPEEINDLPGIGFVEGMACGAAYIGKNAAMYSDLGLMSGKNFIGYNGKYSDLTKKIKYYQNNPLKLKKIADSGYNFARENFNENKVAGKFFDDLEEIYNTYKKHEK